MRYFMFAAAWLVGCSGYESDHVEDPDNIDASGGSEASGGNETLVDNETGGATLGSGGESASGGLINTMSTGGEASAGGAAGSGGALTEQSGGADGSGGEQTDSAGGSESTGGSAQDGSGGSCTEWVYFEDFDGDGFGDPDIGSCTPEPGYVENSDDCYDENELAFPRPTFQVVDGIENWFFEDRGDGSFDFNCDGDETFQHNYLTCKEAAADPQTNNGWSSDYVPDCGVTVGWRQWCDGASIARTQGCK